jgi:hypothetical protein
LGCSATFKHFYKIHQNSIAKHNGTNICLRRKKSKYKTKFNLYFGLYQNKLALVSELSLIRRYKTFVGLLTYSNGSVSAISLFSGARVGRIIRSVPYIKNPKIYFFARFRTGDYIPAAYASVMTCFFNISYSHNIFS